MPAEFAASMLLMKGEVAQAGIYKVLCKIIHLLQLADVLHSQHVPSGCSCYHPCSLGRLPPPVLGLQSFAHSAKFEAKLFAALIEIQDLKPTILMHPSLAPDLILQVSTDALWS